MSSVTANADMLDSMSATEAPVRPQAPGRLGLVQAFVNTLDVEPGREELDSARALRDWLVAHDLARPRDTVNDEDLRRAQELREALRALLLANNGSPIDPSALAVLNRVGEEAALRISFDEQALPHLHPGAPGGLAGLGSLVAIVFVAMTDGTFPKLKACAEQTCTWAFYDSSRNHSRTWCDMAVCGNRVKVRAFRKRQEQGTRKARGRR